MMQTIKASVFKAKCLHLMDQVAETREPLIITKHGKPIAQLGPVVSKPPRCIIGLHSEGRVLGDIISPVVPAEDWDVMK